MIYGTNTIYCCYELVGSSADNAHSHAHAQMHTRRHRGNAQTHAHTNTKSRGSSRANSLSLSTRRNSIFIQDICKLIKTANKDWRNMSYPSGLDTVLSAALAMACHIPSRSFSYTPLLSFMTFLHHLMASCIPFILFCIASFQFLTLQLSFHMSLERQTHYS